MGLLNPILGNTRQEIITPEEQNKIGSSGGSVIGQSYDVDASKFKTTNLDLVITGGTDALAESKARSQTNLGLVGKGIGNVIGTAITELAKLPGYAVGGAMALAQGDITPMIDNQYLDGVKWVQDQTQNKWFDVQVPKAVSEGDALKQLGNPYFWASEGANGVGFLLSFLVPGQAIKAFGLGEKVAAGLAKAGKLSEVIADGEKIIQGGNGFGRVMLKTLGKSGRAMDFSKVAGNVNSGLAVAANTMFESAAEAADLYDQMLGEGSSKEEASLAASQAYKMNLGLLAVSNLFVEKYLFDGFGKSVLKPRQITSEVIAGSKKISESLVQASLRKAPMAVAQGILGEGVLEEGMQTSIQQNKGGGIGDALEQYWSNLTDLFGDSEDSVEFTKSVVLGGILGAGMGAIAGTNEARRENKFMFGNSEYAPTKFGKFIGYKAQEANTGAIELLQNNFKAIRKDKSSLFTFDETGKIKDFAPDAKDKLTEAANLEILSNYYNDKLTQNGGNIQQTNNEFVDELHQAGAKPQDAVSFLKVVEAPPSLSNKEAIAYVRHKGHKQYLDNFLSMEGGAQMAQAHIEDQIQAIQDRYEGSTGMKMTAAQVEELENTLNTELEQSQRLHDFIQTDHVLQRIGFDPVKEDDENPEQTVAKFSTFFNRAKSARLELLRDIEYFKSRQEGALDNAEKDAMTKVIDQMQSRHNEMSTKKGLESLWDKWSNGEKAVETKKAEDKKQVKEIVPIDKDKFWDAVKDASYPVVQGEDGVRRLEGDRDIHIRGKDVKHKILVTIKNKAGDVKISLVDPLNPKKANIYDSLRAVQDAIGDFEIISRDEIEKTRQQRRLDEARAALAKEDKLVQMAIMTQLEELIQIDQAIAKNLAEIDPALDNLSVELGKLKKVTDAGVRAIRKDLRTQIANLKTLKSNLEKKRIVIQAQVDVLTQYLELLKTSSIAQILAEEEQVQRDFGVVNSTSLATFKEMDVLALAEQLNVLDTEIAGFDTKIAFYEKTLAVLDEMVSRHETNVSVLDKSYTQEFSEKYSYLSSTKSFTASDGTQIAARIYPPVGNDQVAKLAEGKFAARLDKHLDQFAAKIGLDAAAVRSEFIEDAKNLQAVQEILADIFLPRKEEFLADSMGEFTQKLKGLIATYKAAVEENKAEMLIVESVKRLKAYQDLNTRLTSKIRSAHANSFKKNPDKAQVVSKNDAGDNLYVASVVKEDDPFWSHALSSELYGSTGLNVLYTRSGEDLMDVQNGQLVSVVNPSKYQKTFFQWIENNSLANYRVEARVAYYDERDGDMQTAFSETNPDKANQEPGNDIFVIIVDKKGAIVKSNDVPVFTSIRRTNTKFPKGKAPKMNMLALVQQYLSNELEISEPITRKSLTSDILVKSSFGAKSRQKFAKEFGISESKLGEMTTTQLFELIQQNSIQWGRNQYQSFRDQIIKTINHDKQVFLQVSGVTKGHPVRVLDETGQIVTYPVQESLALEIHSNGRPKNFTIHKANYKGQIVQGNSIVGGYVPGVVYVQMNSSGNLVPIINDKLNTNEIDLVVFILGQMAGKSSLQGTAGVDIPAVYPEGMTMRINNKLYGKGSSEIKLFPQVDDKFSVINQLMMWGSNSVDGKQDIFISNGTLFFGSNSFALDYIAKHQGSTTGELNQLREYLAFRRSHISYDILDAAQMTGGMYYHPTLKDGKIVFEAHPSYLDYIFSRTKSDVVPKAITDSFGLPQFAQRNLQFHSLEKKPVGSNARAKPTSSSTPTGSGSRKALIEHYATEKWEQELVDRALAMGFTTAELAQASKYTSELEAELVDLGIVKAIDPKLVQLKRLSAIKKIEAFTSALGVMKLIESKEAESKPAPEVTKEVPANVVKPQTPKPANKEMSIQDKFNLYSSDQGEAKEDALYTELIGQGMTKTAIFAKLKELKDTQIKLIELEKLIPPVEGGDRVKNMSRLGKVSRFADFLSLMDLVGDKSESVASDVVDVAPEAITPDESNNAVTVQDRLNQLKNRTTGSSKPKTRGFGAILPEETASKPVPTGVFTEALNETRRLYTTDKAYYSWDVSGDEAWLQLSGRGVTAEDIYNIKEKVGGKLFIYFARAYKTATGEELTQNSLGADQVVSPTQILNNLLVEQIIEQKCD